MADYDCDYCSKSVECGGKCTRFEYNCPFTIVEKYDSEKLESIRLAIGKISKVIELLKELDTEDYMEDEINNVSFQLSLLEDKIGKEIEREWNEITR